MLQCETVQSFVPVERRYAAHASAAFNLSLHNMLEQIADATTQVIGDNLVALILGGGYGRGEGGVVCVDGVEYPYNDLDFTLVVHRANAVPEQEIAVIRQEFAQKIGIHVDYSRPCTLQQMRRWPACLMWWDLVHGHVVLTGSPTILLDNVPAYFQLPLPLIEATRLLLNRGAGLLWALRVVRGIEAEPDDDFVRRNYYKCLLALGDALLIGHQQFTTQYHGRDMRLLQLEATMPDVQALGLDATYRQALQFKFHPHVMPPTPPDEKQLLAVAEQWGDVLLYLEQLRTGRHWESLEMYAQWRGLREPKQHQLSQLPRNVLRNLQSGRCAWRYPREQLYRQLPVLLGLTTTPVTNWPEASAHFLTIWQQCN